MYHIVVALPMLLAMVEGPDRLPAYMLLYYIVFLSRCVPALPMLLAIVEGPDRHPADEGSQEVLRAKLCLLEADSAEVNALFTV